MVLFGGLISLMFFIGLYGILTKKNVLELFIRLGMIMTALGSLFAFLSIIEKNAEGQMVSIVLLFFCVFQLVVGLVVFWLFFENTNKVEVRDLNTDRNENA